MLIKGSKRNKFAVIGSYGLLIITLGILIILGWLISLESDQPIRAWITAVFTGLFLFGTFLVLKTGLNAVNLLFTSSLGLYFAIALLLLLTYYDRSYEHLWPNLIFFLIITPLGMYYSCITLLYGIKHIISSNSVFITFVTVFIASILSFHLYNPFTLINVIVTDIYNAFLLGLIMYHFIQIRSMYNHSIRAFNVLILGFVISISGLLLNALFGIFFGSETPFRAIIPTIGLLLVIVSFINLADQQMLTLADDIQLYIAHFNTKLELIVPKLQLLLKSETIIASKEQTSFKLKQNTKKPTSSLNISSTQQQQFNHRLKDNMNGLTISILIETANAFPDGVTNTWLRKKLKKSESTISDQIKKLVSFGYLAKSVSLSDIRQRPLILTRDGSNFLEYLHYKFSKYLSKLSNSSVNSSNLYSFNDSLENNA